MSGSPEAFDPYLQWLGIDPRARPVNHYSLLGLPLFESDPAKIAAAADQRMGLIRQYQAGPRGVHTQKLLNELARAKICLLNDVSKPAYDQALHQLLYPPPVMPSATAAPPKPKRKLEDIMPPGWDASALPVQQAMPLPPRAIPQYEQPTYLKAASVAELPTSGRQKKSPMPLIAALGGLVVMIGVFGALLIWRLLPWQEVTGDFEIKMPQQPTTQNEVVQAPDPMPMPPVEEPPAEAVVVLQEGSGEVNLTPSTALVAGDIVREVVGTGETLAKWSSPKDIAEWQYKLVKPGFFELELNYISHSSLAGKQVKVGWGEGSKAIRLRGPESPGPLRETVIIVVKRGGQHTFMLRPTESLPPDTFQFLSIRLIPATGP